MSTLLVPSQPAAGLSSAHKESFKTQSFASKQVVCMVVVAFVLRLLVIFALQTYKQQTRMTICPAGTHFAFGFETGSIAGAIARGEGFSSPFGVRTGPTAWIAPVYPLMCAAVFKLFGLYSTASAIVILALNSLFAALTCIPIYLLANRVFDKRVATLAGWVWSGTFFFMRWPTMWVWEVSLSALILAVLVLMSFSVVTDDTWSSWFKLGGLWGLAAITNPSLLGVMPFSLCWIAFHRRRTLRSYCQPVLLTIFLTVAIMAPWFVRNWMVMGKPVFIRDNFGFEFYLGNYHGSSGLAFSGMHPTQNDIQLKLYSQLGELGYVKHFQIEALNFVRKYPEEFAILTLRRIVNFWDGSLINYEGNPYWQPWEMLVLAIPAALGLLLAFGIERNKRASVLLGLVVLLYPVPYYFTYSQERYRHAIEPELLILACFFACSLWDHTKARFGLTTQSPRLKGEAL